MVLCNYDTLKSYCGMVATYLPIAIATVHSYLLGF